MSNKANMHNLDIPIYLNQKIVFDLLASLNNGLVQVTKLKTTSNMDTDVSGGLESDLGNKNIFTLLGVNLNGKLESGKSQEQEQEKVHTPASLFNALKEDLFKQKIVKLINSEENFKAIESGDFVEVRGLVKLNPLIQSFRNIAQIMELMVALQGDGTGKNAKSENRENKKLIDQVNALANSLQEKGMVDLLCETNESFSFTSVVPVYMDYFFNENMSEITEGKFRILGKVTKASYSIEKIDLLRNTSFTLFRENLMNEFFKAFKDSGNENFNFEDVKTTIDAPALLILPIAIYI